MRELCVTTTWGIREFRGEEADNALKNIEYAFEREAKFTGEATDVEGYIVSFATAHIVAIDIK